MGSDWSEARLRIRAQSLHANHRPREDWGLRVDGGYRHGGYRREGRNGCLGSKNFVGASEYRLLR